MSIPKRIRVTEILEKGKFGVCEYLTVGKEYDVLKTSHFGASTETGVSITDDEDEVVFIRVGTSIGHGVMTEVVA